MMMSGPLPTLAATAALGRTSSQPSASMRTSMPVAWVNFLVFCIHMSSSPWTKRFQRSTRSLAPFSGTHLACANASCDNIALPAPSVPAAAAPAVVFRKSRLENFSIFLSSLVLRSQGLSRLRIEQVRAFMVWHEADRLARPEIVALAKNRRELGARELGEHLGIGAGRLDHDDRGRQSLAI